MVYQMGQKQRYRSIAFFLPFELFRGLDRMFKSCKVGVDFLI